MKSALTCHLENHRGNQAKQPLSHKFLGRLWVRSNPIHNPALGNSTPGLRVPSEPNACARNHNGQKGMAVFSTPMPSTSVTTGNPSEFQVEEIMGCQQVVGFHPTPLIKGLIETPGAPDKLSSPYYSTGPSIERSTTD